MPTYRPRTESYAEAYNFYLAKYRGGQKHFIPLLKHFLLFLKGGKKKTKGDVLIIFKGSEKQGKLSGGGGSCRKREGWPQLLSAETTGKLIPVPPSWTQRRPKLQVVFY